MKSDEIMGRRSAQLTLLQSLFRKISLTVVVISIAAILIPPLFCWLSLLGEKRLYHRELGACLSSAINVMIFSSLVWRTIWLLNRITDQQKQIDQALNQTMIELEQRVEERTAQLLEVNAQLLDEICISKAIERKQQQIEKKLHQSELRCRELIEQAPFGIMRFAIDGSLIEANLAWETIWQTSRETLKGYNLFKDAQMRGYGHLPQIQKAFTGEVIALPDTFYNPAINQQTGRSRWIEPFLYPICNEAGVVQEVVMISKDVTDRKWAEVEIQLSQERFRRAILDAPVPIMLHAEDGEVVQINRIWTELTGYTPEEIPTIADWVEKAYESRRACAQAEVDCLYQLHQCLSQRERLITTRTGKTRIWEFHSASMGRLPDGRRLVITTALDITERKQVEEALRQMNETLESRVRERTAELSQSNSLLQATLEATADGILVLDAQGKKVNCNAQFLDLWQLPDAIVEALKQGSNEELVSFVVRQLKKPEAFLQATQQMLGCPDETSDILEFHDGRIFEQYSRPQWIENRCMGRVLSFRNITKRRRAEAALQASEAELRSLFTAMSDIVLVRDAEGRCLKIAPTRSTNLYEMAEGVLGKTLHETLPQAQADMILNCIQQALETQQMVQSEYNLLISNRDVHFSVNFSPLSANTVLLVKRDISERKRIERELFREKELAQVTLHSIGDAVITTNALGQIQYLNPVAETLTGWHQADAQGLPLTDVFHIVNEITREPEINPVEKAVREGRIVELANQTTLIARDGREFAIDDSAAPIRASDGKVIGAVMVFHDVSHTRYLTNQLSWQASHDALTGLTNRREFEHRLEQAVNSTKAENQTHALCYLDLDQFKIVNDSCGHIAGDELLRQIAALLQSQIRKTDTLARLGGDEFGVLLNQCPLEQAFKVANAMREQVQTFRFVWQDKQFTVGISIGLVVIDAYSKDLASVLSQADAACYAAKNKGRNRVHVYQNSDLELARQQDEMQWVIRLSQALETNRFCLYYQPIVPVGEAEFSGEHYEVLLRLQDEMGNLVSPMAFIPAAERYNLMHVIDRWVIRTLFASQKQHYQEVWNRSQARSRSCYLYAINLSGASINDEQFIDFLYEQFALHQIPPQLICFEITETVAIANLSKAAQLIEELRGLGCRFALDDFGSGMSSFAYLKHLPVDYLKIDGGFIKHMVEDPIDLAIVEAIKQIGQVMGIQTIAEFVENEAILNKVRMLGVNYAQGYSIAAPHPLLCGCPV